MSLIDWVASVQKVRWSSSTQTSVLLCDRGINHGFSGRINSDLIKTMAPHYPKQIHGTRLITADHRTHFATIDRPEGDGIITLESNSSIIAVRTADCVPVLAASTQGGFAAAVHAGWRGLTAGILRKTLDLSHTYRPLHSLIFAIGPAISRDKFEVGPEVIEAISSPSCGLPDVAQALITAKGRQDRWHVDLQLAAVCQLLAQGIAPEAIEVIRACTFLDIDTVTGENIWNSYRRDGRGCNSNWSWISI
jgi:YfiH family protein